MKRLTPLLIAVLAGCASMSAGPAAITGQWGGEHIAMTATAESVIFEFDCASGRIDGPLIVQSSGRFAANGTFSPGHGGPVRQDEVPIVQPARYLGSVRGDAMRLSIDIPAARQTIGSLTLRKDAEPRVFRCL
jgi:hypothetical protein